MVMVVELKLKEKNLRYMYSDKIAPLAGSQIELAGNSEPCGLRNVSIQHTLTVD